MHKRKIQLKAMNDVLLDYAINLAIEQNLKMNDINSIKQSVNFSEPYNNMEVYKSNNLYGTLINSSNKIIDKIIELKNKDLTKEG